MTYRQIADKKQYVLSNSLSYYERIDREQFLTKINSGAYRVNLMYSSKVAKIIVLMFSYSTEMKKTINNTSHCVSLRRWQPKS